MSENVKDEYQQRIVEFSLEWLIQQAFGNMTTSWNDGIVADRNVVYNIRKTGEYGEVVVIDGVRVFGKEKMKEIKKQAKKLEKDGRSPSNIWAMIKTDEQQEDNK